MSQIVKFMDGSEYDISKVKFFEPVVLFHPGECLNEKLSEMGMSVSDFSTRTGLPETLIRSVLRCERTITSPIAELISAVTGIEVSFWLRVQHAYDLYRRREAYALRKKRCASTPTSVHHTDVEVPLSYAAKSFN